MDYIAEALRITNQKRIADGLPPLKHFGAGEDGIHHDYVEPIHTHRVFIPIPIESSSSPAPQESLVFPDEIRIWPQIVLQAAQQNLGGAIRVWTFAKALDKSGSGVIEKQQLLAYLESLKIPTASRYRWLCSASQNSFLRPVRNGESFLITGVQKIGQLIHSQDIGTRCLISSKTLTHSHWKSSVWDLVLTQFKNRPVSRSTLSNITCIPIRTQIHMERYGLVDVRQNWCVMDADPDLIHACNEFDYPYAFTAQIGNQLQVVRQLPNNYAVPRLSGAPDGGGYRRKSYTAASVSANSDSPESSRFSAIRIPGSNSQDGGARCGRSYRLYFDQPKPFKRTLRKLGRAGIHTTLFEQIVVPIRKSTSSWYREEAV
jgi:hypothetical protein